MPLAAFGYEYGNGCGVVVDESYIGVLANERRFISGGFVGVIPALCPARAAATTGNGHKMMDGLSVKMPEQATVPVSTTSTGLKELRLALVAVAVGTTVTQIDPLSHHADESK